MLLSCESVTPISKRKWISLFQDIYLTGKQFPGTSKEALRKSRFEVNMRERMLYSPERRKEQRGMNRVMRNNKERRTKCMRESRGSRRYRAAEMAGYEVVWPFKSWFFWPHCHSQNSSIYPSDVEQGYLQESTMLHVTIRVTSSAINSSYLLTANYSYLYVFTSRIRFLPQGKS